MNKNIMHKEIGHPVKTYSQTDKKPITEILLYSQI
jgi:hypothetical protein